MSTSMMAFGIVEAHDAEAMPLWVILIACIALAGAAIIWCYRYFKDNTRRKAADYFVLGVAREEEGDRVGALEAYTAAITLEPQWEVPYNYRGNIYCEIDKYDEAITDYLKAIRLNPKDSCIYDYLTIARYNKNAYAYAIADCTKEIELDPQDVVAYHYRGHARHRMGDYEGALQDWTKALELDPSLKPKLEPTMQAAQEKLNGKKTLCSL